MRKLIALCIVGIFLFISAASYAQKPADKHAPQTKRIKLTDVQVKMLLGIEAQIEALAEVKTLRARQQGIIAGIATSNGLTRWTWKGDDKSDFTIEGAEETNAN